jgi:hypothetical protein
MKWCEGHLNFTVVFFTVFAWAFGIILVQFALDISGYDYLPLPGQTYYPPNPFSTLFVNTFTFQAMTDASILVSLPIFYWVLKKKKRSIWYLLLFLVPLIPTPIAGFVLLFQMPFYLVGWVFLLARKNKSQTQQTVKS